MRRNRLLHIESVEIHPNLLQAFRFFLGIIWEDVEIIDIESTESCLQTIDLSMPDNIKSELIMHLWRDWSEKLMHDMYAVRN